MQENIDPQILMPHLRYIVLLVAIVFIILNPTGAGGKSKAVALRLY